MIPFVTLDDVKTRMAIGPEVQGVDDIIASGITAAYLFVRSQLDSDFEQQVRTDMFYLDQSMNGGITPNGFWRLRLLSGMVDTSHPIIVTNSDSWDMSNPTVQTANLTHIDAQKGLVSLPHYVNDRSRGSRMGGFWGSGNQGGIAAGQYVTVQYTSGFTQSTTIDTTNPGNPITTTTVSPAVPDWLKEAILSYVPSVFYAQQPTNKPAKGDENGDNADLVRHVMSVLDSYSRTGLSFYLNPVV